jgi:hypothetical protein
MKSKKGYGVLSREVFTCADDAAETPGYRTVREVSLCQTVCFEIELKQKLVLFGRDDRSQCPNWMNWFRQIVRELM